MADPGRETQPNQVVQAAWAFYLLIALGGVIWIGLRLGTIPYELFLDPVGWPFDLLAGLACGALLVLAWRVGVRRLAAAQRLEARLAAILGPLSGEQAVALALFSGVAEELFFRGAVQGAWGIAWATALFALLHNGPGTPPGLWTVFAALAGALFGALTLWRGNLLAAIVAHVLVNAVNLQHLGRVAAEAAAGGGEGGE